MKKTENRCNMVYLLSFVFCMFSFYSLADEVCELKFNTCPEDFNGDTIFVPPQVIALSSSIYTCDPSDIIEGIKDTSAPPSIVFVIDHSYSMMGLGNVWPGNDVDGTRFNVTRDLIDTIYRLHPDAEIGLVVFREVLFFDHRNNDLLVQLEGQGDQSYMPLLQLNSNVDGNVTGIQALQSILETKTITGYNNAYDRSVTCVDLVYKPRFSTIGNTNINNAMAAALQAMKAARNPRERQFIIFLSDGEPFPIDSTIRGYDDILRQHGGKDPFYFQQGATMPTTFTVYLANNDTIPPPSLSIMTSNIKANGYSASNQSSDIWILKTNYDALMSLFMKKVIKPILTLTSGTATSMVINNVISTRLSDSGFVFSDRFPLNENTTRFDIKIKYHLKNMQNGSERDTQSNVLLHVVRKNGAEIPDGVISECWDKASLSLYYNGTKVTSVNESMEKLEIRFDPGDRKYESVIVEVTHAQGQNRDLENIRLENGSSYWSKKFSRKIDSPHRGDSTLQHQMQDSIIVIYRNSKIPLDTIRISVPFIVSKAVAFIGAAYYDNDADGFIDSIFLNVNGPLDANANEMLKNTIMLPSFRNFMINSFSITSGGLAIRVKEQSQTPRTFITPQDIITVGGGVLPGGGLLQSGVISVSDRVAPVILRAEIVSSGAEKDTLKVYFSEPVKQVSSARPYRFKVPDGNEYQVFLENGKLNIDFHSSLIQQVQTGFSVKPGDSIWINPSASVTDTSGNSQLNELNRRAQLSIKQVPYKLIPEVVNNPFVPGFKIPDQVQNAYKEAGRLRELNTSDGGLIIVVRPESSLRPHIQLSGKVSIYDVVKNTVIEDIQMVFDNDYKQLLYVWNGTNHKGRKVATGTYLAILEMSDNIDHKETRTIPIGVKR